jgi:hypothetical protein
MKEFLTKTLILALGLGLTMTFTACHTESGTAPVVTKVNPTHSISGTILTSDGKALNGAVVTIGGKAVTVTGNTFAVSGLKDGTYEIEVKCDGYWTVTTTEPLSVTPVNGEMSGMNVERTFYLAKKVESDVLAISQSTSASDQITIETTDYTDGDGAKGNDTDESITIDAEIPMVSGDEYNAMDAELKAQGEETGLANFTITLSNITCLEDAQAVARLNKVAASRQTRAITSMGDEEGNELLAGVAVNAGSRKVTMPANKPFVVTAKMPNDVKSAITLFRTITGDRWTKIDLNNLPADIASVDFNTDGVIKINLKEVKTQSFGFGVIVEEEELGTDDEDIVAKTVTNNTASTSKLSEMKYTVKSGVVLGEYSKSSLTDFLRKMMIRKYGTRLVKTAKSVEKTYEFSPAYSMHPYGVMHLEGIQFVNKVKFSVANSQAYYNVVEYADWYVFPYEEWSEIEPVVVHGGGSN